MFWQQPRLPSGYTIVSVPHPCGRVVPVLCPPVTDCVSAGLAYNEADYFKAAGVMPDSVGIEVMPKPSSDESVDEVE